MNSLSCVASTILSSWTQIALYSIMIDIGESQAENLDIGNVENRLVDDMENVESASLNGETERKKRGTLQDTLEQVLRSLPVGKGHSEFTFRRRKRPNRLKQREDDDENDENVPVGKFTFRRRRKPKVLKQREISTEIYDDDENDENEPVKFSTRSLKRRKPKKKLRMRTLYQPEHMSKRKKLLRKKQQGKKTGRKPKRRKARERMLLKGSDEDEYYYDHYDVPVDECQMKWAALMDCRRKSLKDYATSTKLLRLEKEIEFLNDLIADRRQILMFSQEDCGDEEDDQDPASLNSEIRSSPYSPAVPTASSSAGSKSTTKQSDPAGKILKMQKKDKIIEEEYLHKYFLSAEETVRAFSVQLQTEIKQKISDLLHEYEMKAFSFSQQSPSISHSRLPPPSVQFQYPEIPQSQTPTSTKPQFENLREETNN